MKKTIFPGIAAMLLIIIAVKTSAQEVYHFPKEENFQVFGDCFNELRAIKDKAEERTLQYEADVADYKKGLFCSDCKRSATRIEREDHISFTQHIADGESHGRKPIPATKGMYDTLYMNYRADWDPQKKAYDAKFIDCQGNVKSSQAEANDAISNFETKYNEANATVNNIRDPQKRARYQQQLTTTQSVFLQYRAQAQQQLTQKNADALLTTTANINKQRDVILNLMNDISTAVSAEHQGPSNSTVQIAHITTKPTSNGSATTQRQSRPKTGTTNYAQQFQQSQNNNQQAQQTINSTFDGLKNQVQQLYDQRAADRQESYERDMQKLKDEERQREENVDRRIKASNESNRQTAIDMDQILDYGNFNSNPPHSEKIPDNAKQSFYITYERDYASNRITLKTYTLNKYSDGTWMSEPDIQKKIDFTRYMSSSDRYTDLLGPYASTANAMMVINKIKTNAGGIAGSITTDDSFAPLNKPANPTANKDFWNN